MKFSVIKENFLYESSKIEKNQSKLAFSTICSCLFAQFTKIKITKDNCNIVDKVNVKNNENKPSKTDKNGILDKENQSTLKQKYFIRVLKFFRKR